jgi:hypothetical protein
MIGDGSKTGEIAFKVYSAEAAARFLFFPPHKWDGNEF